MTKMSKKMFSLVGGGMLPAPIPYRYPSKTTVLPRVDIIMATENMDGALIRAAAAAGAKGIVIAGVGNGNMTKPALEALAAQAKKGIVCVRSTRVTTGEVGRNVEVKDDSLNFVASLGLNPQKARVLLRLALFEFRNRFLQDLGMQQEITMDDLLDLGLIRNRARR